jgi:subtilisin family serine protease
MVRQWNVAEDRTVVDYAYLHPGPEVPPMSTPAQAILQQAHLGDAPEGIGANYAHTQPGGRGEGVCFADLERGWNPAHKDLVGHNFDAVNPGFYREIDHGTAVLGIIAAHDNARQSLGIAPGIDRIVTVGTCLANNVYVTDAAVLAASEKLAAGDVLLIEAQSRSFGGRIPLEAEKAVAAMIELACKSRIVVVAAAGNGARNLDTLTDDNNNLLFNNPSETIIVAGGKRDAQGNWVREDNSNFGNRVDCFAQGVDVATLSSDDPWDTMGTTPNFGGTSSAAAIVAGAVVCIQGIARKRRNRKLTPPEVRDLLTHSGSNTQHASYTDEIGLMPDLKRIIDEI